MFIFRTWEWLILAVSDDGSVNVMYQEKELRRVNQYNGTFHREKYFIRKKSRMKFKWKKPKMLCIQINGYY